MRRNRLASASPASLYSTPPPATTSVRMPLRRSAAAITAAVVTVVLPFLLAGLNIVPSGVGAWLLRLTPTAGLAIQQSIPRYPQVASVVDTVRGYWPLSPYAGFGVLCLWAAAALGLAFVLLRQRDA